MMEFLGCGGYTLDEPTASNSPGNDFGVVATQLLDSPKATDNVDLDQDGTVDIFPGEPLKMTDWHWVDWYQRPGVVSQNLIQVAATLGMKAVQ